MTNGSNQRKFPRQRCKAGLKLKKISIIPKQEILLNCIQPQLSVCMFRLAPQKWVQPPLLPPKATEQRCANVNKFLKSKQTSCSKISQLPFRNKCPAFIFLKPWQGNSLPRSNQGLRWLIPHSLRRVLFFFTEFRNCHTPIRYISDCRSESRQLMLLNIFRWLSLNLLCTQEKTKT